MRDTNRIDEYRTRYLLQRSWKRSTFWVGMPYLQLQWIGVLYMLHNVVLMSLSLSTTCFYLFIYFGTNWKFNCRKNPKYNPAKPMQPEWRSRKNAFLPLDHHVDIALDTLFTSAPEIGTDVLLYYYWYCSLSHNAIWYFRRLTFLSPFYVLIVPHNLIKWKQPYFTFCLRIKAFYNYLQSHTHVQNMTSGKFEPFCYRIAITYILGIEIISLCLSDVVLEVSHALFGYLY